MSQAILHVSKPTSRTAYQHELGRRVAELLSGAWRDSEVPPTLSEAELAEIVPLLCESGAGALAWWRIRNTPLADTESGRQLHDVYRRHRLSALIHEREIAYVLSLLRAEGIEPVVIKGWAIARLYPDAGLRPYGDIDLCVRPDQFAQAGAALKCLEAMDGHYVDLHSGFARIGQTRREGGRSRRQEAGKEKLARRVWDELFSRSQLVSLDQSGAVARPSGRASQDQSKVASPMSKALSPSTDLGPWTLDFGQSVRVLSDEDHLRILSAHLLRSGARRPPWLCDIALLLEQVQRPKSKVQSPSAAKSDFNWDVCRRDRLHDNWVASAVMLAHELLGADISHTPFAIRRAPRWLVPAVLRQWGRTRNSMAMSNWKPWLRHRTVRKGSAFPETVFSFSEARPQESGGAASRSFERLNGEAEPHRTVLRPSRGLEWLGGLWTKLDNPVRATAAVGGQFNNLPRLPYRVAELLMRLPEVPEQLVSLLQQFAARPSKRLRRVAAV